ncbi:hypothetical protein Acr_04g0004500 [Actinidia rufa]|uniref:Uncharacterized protein n=1 Tax=Actinidia rufa TaxID=165716 RepID=A0A7J0EHG0_9ERIC|nr:hypothetical protein Acr_04g0004500 [Actinidia rufa]
MDTLLVHCPSMAKRPCCSSPTESLLVLNPSSRTPKPDPLNRLLEFFLGLSDWPVLSRPLLQPPYRVSALRFRPGRYYRLGHEGQNINPIKITWKKLIKPGVKDFLQHSLHPNDQWRIFMGGLVLLHRQYYSL